MSLDTSDNVRRFALDYGWALEQSQRPTDGRDYDSFINADGTVISIAYASNGRVKQVFIDREPQEFVTTRNELFELLRRKAPRVDYRPRTARGRSRRAVA